MKLELLLLSLTLCVVRSENDEYQFRYRVTDQETGQDFGQEEEKLGEATGGEYQVLLPDGRTQIVRYQASDPSGFIASVEYQGEVTIQDSPVQSLRAARKLRPAVETINLAGRSPLASVTPAVIPVPSQQPNAPIPRLATPRVVLKSQVPQILPNIPAPRIIPSIPSIPVSKEIPQVAASRRIPRPPAPRLISNVPAPRIIPSTPLKKVSPVRVSNRPRQAKRINPLSSRREPVKTEKEPTSTKPKAPAPPPKVLKTSVTSKPRVRNLPLPVVRSKIVLPTPTTTKKPLRAEKVRKIVTDILSRSPQRKGSEKPVARKNQARKGKTDSMNGKSQEVKLPKVVAMKKKVEKQNVRKNVSRQGKKILKTRKEQDAKLPAMVMPKRMKATKSEKSVTTRSPVTKPSEAPAKTTESPVYKASSEAPKMEYKDSDHVASASSVLNSLFREDTKSMSDKEEDA